MRNKGISYGTAMRLYAFSIERHMRGFLKIPKSFEISKPVSLMRSFVVQKENWTSVRWKKSLAFCNRKSSSCSSFSRHGYFDVNKDRIHRVCAESGRDYSSVFPVSGRRMILTDAMALLYRSHFAFSVSHRLQTSKGEDTTVIFGFLSTLLSLLELNPSPTHFAVVFDSSGKTFRHELYSDYKAHRPEAPPEIGEAVPKLQELLNALGIAVVTLPGVEADDVIGTLAVRGVDEGLIVAIASPDKDFFQLLRPGLILLRPPKKSGPSTGDSKPSIQDSSRQQKSSTYNRYALVPYTENDFSEEWGGLTPGQFVDALAMMGDASDNVPGITGIGKKTAVTILQQSGTLDNALSMSLDGALKPKRANTLLTAPGMTEAAKLSRALVEIRTTLDFPPAQIPLDRLRLLPPPEGGKKALKMLEELEFSSHAARFAALWRKYGWL